MPNTERFWLKKNRAKEKGVNTVSEFVRLQFVLHRRGGEVVTSTRLKFNQAPDEYFTIETVAFLTRHNEADILKIVNAKGMPMKPKGGQRWLAAQDAILLLGLLL